MLRIQQLCKRFGKSLVVDHVDLTVQCGQIRGLLGPNGAGKSTTIRMICGVFTPDCGSVLIDGVDLAKSPQRAKLMLGYVPESAPLPPELLPIEYLKYTAAMYNLRGADRAKAIGHWSDRCDLTDSLRKPIGILSRGYRQRVSLVAALMHRPKLVVLDEPSTGLDPAQSASFRELIQEVADNAAVLYSSHHLAEIEETCDVVSIIHQGSLIVDSDFESLQQENAQIEVEVSPHAVVEAIGGVNAVEIDAHWVRCLVDIGTRSVEDVGEGIANTVASEGGRLRLLQPIARSLESSYLQLIRDAEVRE